MRAVLMLTVLASVLPGAVMTSVIAQKPDEATRKLWDTAFIKPITKKDTRRRPRSYRIATPKVPIDKVAPESVVGVTIWRLRPAAAGESGERIIVHEEATKQWVPERISPETRLSQGDKLRISVEGARKGYLYVIDREQYADGSLGEPYLIFPTTRTLGGDNRVDVGKLTEIPAQDDSPPYFVVRKSRPDHVAEVVSVLVSPTPLEGISITDKAQQLSEKQVAEWESQWSNGVGFLEMDKSVGQTWTRAERDAGASNTRALTSEGPAPQLLFYRASAKPTDPLFVKLQLWYRSSKSRS